MRHLVLQYLFIAFLALENEGHREDCINCFTERVVHNSHDPGPRQSVAHHHMAQGLSESSSRNVPQYRPIIAAYHPRVNNRQQFFSRNADHLLDESEESHKSVARPNFEAIVQPITPPPAISQVAPQPVAPHRSSSSNEFYPTFQAQRHPSQFRPPTQLPAPPPTQSHHSYLQLAPVPVQPHPSTSKRVNPFQSQYLNTFNMSPMTTTPLTTTTTTSTTTTTTTSTTPAPIDDYDEEYDNQSYQVTTTTTTTTARPNYRPRPVSVRPPFGSARNFRSPQRTTRAPQAYDLANNPDAGNNIISESHANAHSANHKANTPPKPRRPKQRKRQRTTTTTTESPANDDDYYEYDQEYDDDYDYQATTTTTTTQRPRRGGGRRRGRGRGGGRRRQRPTEPPTTTTTTTLSPNYKPRPDGRIIDYNADPNFPYELKGADLTEYPFYISIPESNFNCKGRHDGYYADIELKCQVYHHCAIGHQRYDFLCPNYTLFDQTTFTCRFINTVDCSASENHYGRNDELYVQSTTPAPREDARFVRPKQQETIVDKDKEDKSAPKASASNVVPSIAAKENDNGGKRHDDKADSIDRD